MNCEYKQVAPEEILSEFHLARLSPNAVKVYSAIWNRMAYKGVDQLWLDDADLSIRARISIQLIPAIQTKLARSGLMRLVPGTSKVLYEFVENPDDARQDAPLVGAEATQ